MKNYEKTKKEMFANQIHIWELITCGEGISTPTTLILRW